MKLIQTGILNDNFKKIKGCITAQISDIKLPSQGDGVKICKDLFIPIKNLYYHITCLTKDTSLSPKSLSEKCKGYLKKLGNDTTAESTFYIYGSKLYDHIVEASKCNTSCKIVEDCNVILNDTANQMTMVKMLTKDSEGNSTSLFTKSDSNSYIDVDVLIIFTVTYVFLVWFFIYCSGLCFERDGDMAVEDCVHSQNMELTADNFSGTKNDIESVVDNFSSTKDEIELAVDNFSSTKDEIELAVDNFSSTKDEIELAVDNFSGTQNDVELAVDNFSGIQNDVELAADNFSSTQSSLNNDYAGNQHEVIVELNLIGYSHVTSV